MEDKTVSLAAPDAPYIDKLKKLFEKKPRKVAVFTHAYPDPDAIGSMMGVQWLLKKLHGVEARGFYSGPVSHPQNIAMVNLLDPDLSPITDYRPDDYDLHVLVDTVPCNAGISVMSKGNGNGNGNHGFDITFDLVIDHHKEVCPTDFEGLFINLKAGSCCGTVYDIICKMDVEFSESDLDAQVATALLIGITTDTENLMSDDSTEYEFAAWAGLFPFRNPQALRKIANFDRPKLWVDTKAAAVPKTIIEDSVGIVGMGMIAGKHRDMIADMAQEMVGWEGVDTAVAFALVDGDRIEGSVRSTSAAISVPKLCHALGGKFGKGGGKLGKGAYKIDLAGGGLDEEEPAEIRARTWELYAEKELRRIQRVLKK